MTFGPPGHIPGFHAPGTLTPVGAIYEMQQAAQQQQHQRVLQLLLLLSR